MTDTLGLQFESAVEIAPFSIGPATSNTTVSAGVLGIAVPGPQGPAGAPADNNALVSHIVDETPHPAYDDFPSFTLLFENHLV